jgi:hypothetical protein
MKAPALLAVLALLSACTIAQRETSRREWAQADCNRIVDPAERNLCMRRADSDWGTTGGLEQRVPPPR